MSDLKAELKELGDKMHELGMRADKLRNKHLRDVIGAGLGRFKDALSHPDMEAANDEDAAREKEKSQREREAEAAAQGDKGLPFPVMAYNANGTAWKEGDGEKFDVDGKPLPAEDKKTFHPGDPKFDQANRNPDFKNPHNVDLNPDGTLKTAPNAFSRADDRTT